jgi:alkylhydroperoxidase/carboxymuconolactone decarboxylase family protein YurZ
LKKHFAVAKEAGATEAELREAIAYGVIAPSGRAKNFALNMLEEMG